MTSAASVGGGTGGTGGTGSAARRPLRMAVVGLGRMGRLVAEVASERGHAIAREIGRDGNEQGQALTAEALQGVDVALELTRAEAAPDNVRRCLEAGVAVACGTTGWATDERVAELRDVSERTGAGLLIAPNFAVGVLLFRRLVQRAAELAARDGLCDLWIEESHHRGKADWPSGTALALARDVLERLPRKKSVRRGAPDGPAREDELLVSSARGGFEPGLHRVVIDAPDECIELVHRARSRRAFAAGAVRAAEWLAGRSGVHDLSDLIDGES